MPTPQTNITLDEIADRFAELDDFVICGHVNPDGDCLGSQLALMHALRALGKKAHCVLAKPDPVDANLAFLPSLDEMAYAAEYQETPQVFVAVDVPTTERIGSAARLQRKAAVRFTIDHHANETTMSDHNFVEPAAPATAMLIWYIAKRLGAVNQQVALCALTGLITDTGRFAYQNTNPESFRAAAEMMEAGASPALVNREFFQNRSLPSIELERIVLQRMMLIENDEFALSYLTPEDFEICKATKADAEPLIDILRSVRGVRVALILRQNERNEVRGSLRAKDDETDVAQVARYFEGGGHKAAAGFTFHGTMEQALLQVPAVVRRLCFANGDADGEN